MGYLLGTGSSNLDGAGYPLALELWDLIKDRTADDQTRNKIQTILDDGAAGIEQALDLLDDGEEAAVLAAARESPEWSSRQLATWVTDHLRLSVGESTVYRILKREGLVKPPEIQLVAGKEYQ